MWQWRAYALLLARVGRVGEALDALAPRLEDWVLQRSPLEVTQEQNGDWDQHVLRLLAPLAQEAARARASGQTYGYRGKRTVELQAKVFERAGRTDEALGVLAAVIDPSVPYGLQNTVELYAELLARHGRLDTLREMVTGKNTRAALRPFMGAMADHARSEEAESVARALIEKCDSYRWPLVDHLAKQGRFDEATEVARPSFAYPDCDGPLMGMAYLLDDAGRAAEAVALFDERSPECVEEHAEWAEPVILYLMPRAGRAEEAIARARALPQEDFEDKAVLLADVLERGGYVEEAITVLQGSTAYGVHDALAETLIRQGRTEEAIASYPAITTLREEYAARFNS